MAELLLGLAVWILFAAAAWKYSTARPALGHSDRLGTAVFFIVVGFPFFIVGLALILQPLIA